MKKTVLKYGLISGIIVSTTLILSAMIGIEEVMMGKYGMLIGFGSMIIAFAFVFVGIKKYRDNFQDGRITFGKALGVGLLISLIASTFYVLTWLVEFYALYPDFIEKYIGMSLEKAKAAGASAEKLQSMEAEFGFTRKMYSSPLGIAALTYVEIFPIGIVASLIAAAVMKRNRPAVAQ